MTTFCIVAPADLIEYCKDVAQGPCGEAKRAAFERIYAVACIAQVKGKATMQIDGQLSVDFTIWLLG